MSRQPKNPALLNATQGDVVALINLIMSPIVRDLKAEIAALKKQAQAGEEYTVPTDAMLDAAVEASKRV